MDDTQIEKSLDKGFEIDYESGMIVFNDFTFDIGLKMSGDFGDKRLKRRFLEQIAHRIRNGGLTPYDRIAKNVALYIQFGGTEMSTAMDVKRMYDTLGIVPTSTSHLKFYMDANEFVQEWLANLSEDNGKQDAIL